jgi:hypothetical protein
MSNETKTDAKGQDAYIPSSRIEVCVGMPKKEDPIYQSWMSETVTKLFMVKYIAMFVGLFVQDEESSIHIVDMENDKTMALSGTRDYIKHCDSVTNASVEIKETPEENSVMNAVVKMHMRSIAASLKIISNTTKDMHLFHNTGLLVDEAYRGRKVLDEATGQIITVGSYVYQQKLKYLTEKFKAFIICTNANNKGSQRIFEENSMQCIQTINFKENGVPHEGDFKTYYLCRISREAAE